MRLIIRNVKIVHRISIQTEQFTMRFGAQFTARLCRLPKQELKIPNSDGDRRPTCKYRTSGKKLLQN